MCLVMVKEKEVASVVCLVNTSSTSSRGAITRNLSMRQSNELDGISGGSDVAGGGGGGDRDSDFTEKTVSHATFRFGFISGGRKFYSLRFFRKYRVIDFTLRVHGVEPTIGNVKMHF